MNAGLFLQLSKANEELELRAAVQGLFAKFQS